MPFSDSPSRELLLKQFRSLLHVFVEKNSKTDGGTHPLIAIKRHAKDKGGSLQSPLTIFLDLTDTCNQECIFCPTHILKKDTPDGQDGHLPLEFLDDLCRQFSQMGVPTIILTGGEPTCHPDFMKAVALIKQYDLALTIATNGINLNDDDIRNLSRLIEPERDAIRLSLDAASRETYRILRGSEEFDSLINTLELLNRFRIPFCTNTLLLRCNAEQIDDILSLAGKHGSMESSVGIPLACKGIPEGIYAPPDQILRVYKGLMIRKDEYHSKILLNIIHLSLNMGCLPETIQFFRQAGKPLMGCHAGSTSCAINVQGDLNICQFTLDSGLTVGSIFETPLQVLWQRAKAMKRELEKQAQDSCHDICPAVTFLHDSLIRTPFAEGL